MDIIGSQARRQPPDRSRSRSGLTLIELLVVITIIAVLAALLFPALAAARASSRRTACQSNLKQFYVGMMARAGTHGTFCSGAFDWNRDGPATEVGWVADLVNSGTAVGKMLCPSNTAQISEAYKDLLGLAPAGLDPCVDHVGSPPKTAPDGTSIVNPCREIVETSLVPLTEPRRLLVEQRILDKFYNTNYTASWFLVRSGVVLDGGGNLKSAGVGCEVSLKARGSTLGPLAQAHLDSGSAFSGTVPILGCGQAKGVLPQTVGPHEVGTPMVMSFTEGPVLDPTMDPPSFAAGTPRDGPVGWWAVWNNTTIQNYRGFGPVHRGAANVLFADGSVRTIADKNEDGLINNGFSAAPTTGFASDEIEVTEGELFSRWSLRARQ